MLKELEEILQASAKVATFDILDHDPIDADHFLVKIRCRLTTGTQLQIRLRGVAGQLRYSYQEFDVNEIQRWDNAPHFPQINTHPHHYHDAQGNVQDSPLRGDPLIDLPFILNLI